MYRNPDRALGEEPMERYETAKLDFVALGEDVVTASRTITECVPQYNPSVDGI